MKRALALLPRHPAFRVALGLVAVLALVGMLLAYQRARTGLDQVVDTCRAGGPVACRAAAENAHDRVIDQGPSVFGADPSATPTTAVTPSPLPGRQPADERDPGPVTTLPAVPPDGPPPVIVPGSGPATTTERTVTRELTVAGTPTRVTETVTEPAPPPQTVIVERTVTETVPASSPDDPDGAPPVAPPDEQSPDPATPTALPSPWGWLLHITTIG